MAVLLGRQSAGTTADFNAAGHAAAWTFVASASGSLKYLFSQTKVSNPTGTGIELGVYANGAGVPGARLGFAAIDVLADGRGTGVFRATLATPVTIVSGTTYWLARYMATEQCDFQGDASAGTYSETTSPSDMVDPWPATAAGGTTTIIWGESVDAASAPAARPMLFALQKFRPLWTPTLFAFPVPVPSAPTGTTWTGSSTFGITVGYTTAGTRTTFGVSTTPIVVGYTTSGTRKTFGVSSFPIVVGYTTAATRKTFGTSSFPIVVGYTTAGTRKTFGVSSYPIVVGYTTAGTRKLFGASTFPVVVGYTTAGLRTATGASTFPINVNYTTTGTLSARGSSTFPIVFNFTTTGSGGAGVAGGPIQDMAFFITTS